ncbi:hypothetical protein Lalb_Chr18g0059411 [Lupinus albus]|uniref:Uncharacterized protein n=1 Tax=Lupinus albus TaxID=3870 RepID=A0A6A4P5N6_LUPAL|nr:hypothetical protein Lalb_Chr18g0059411 [Lupinus albus]
MAIQAITVFSFWNEHWLFLWLVFWFFFFGKFCLFDIVVGMRDFAEEVTLSGNNLKREQKGC